MTALTFAAAQTIVATAHDHARTQNLKPLAFVVLDAGGHLVAAGREDGATFFRTEIAKAKATCALGMGVDTAVTAERAKGNPTFYAGIVTTLGGDVVFSPGGVLIHDADGVVIGAVGVSGDTGEADAACANVGIKAAGLIGSN
ncbi:heme-binding protein [Novosphingobium sp. FSY-8]|uniref:Heme-binding protein n=1 Tax=Novosphingobium ovatum TaxID=1908523 RepID=A0ABW9XHU8_9SPHN|nr:heme-binding protein [Novosphingobium ovatum]NBC38142.1 heme-binding protein [Novosphingobium ovatum]